VNWARKGSLWPYPFGTACCAIEFMATVSSHYEHRAVRFGSGSLLAKAVRCPHGSGTINDKMAPVLKQIYDQMAEPKWVISMGACATLRRFLSRVPRDAGHRRNHSGGRVTFRLPAGTRSGARRRHQTPGTDHRGHSPFLRTSSRQTTLRTRKKTPPSPARTPPRALVRFLEEKQELDGPIAKAFKEIPDDLIGNARVLRDLSSP